MGKKDFRPPAKAAAMRIPYVIDNQAHRLAHILIGLLREHRGRSLDVATAHFTVAGAGLIKEGLLGLGNFRLLLGAEPASGEQLGLRPDSKAIKGLLTRDLEALPFDEKTLRMVEDLIAFLKRNAVKVRLDDKSFLHAKCWLFYSDRPGQQMLFDRFRPILAIVGSSNFTAPGLSSNCELNLTHKVLIDPEEVEDHDAARAVAWVSDARTSERITAENRQLLKSEVGARAIIDLEGWYERNWNDSRDFKDDLIELLDASKFGRKEYIPFEIYMKALYEYFKDEPPRATRSADGRRGRDGARKKVILLTATPDQQRPDGSLQPACAHNRGRPKLLCSLRYRRRVPILSCGSPLGAPAGRHVCAL
jgi:hypothetical protein